jgi:hypothetical protein
MSGGRYRSCSSLPSGRPALLASTPQTSDTTAPLAFTTLGRRLVVHGDEPEIVDYLRSAYRRVLVPLPEPMDDDCDTGRILANGGPRWLEFNGAPVEYLEEKPTTNFRLAFYGSSKLMRLSFQRNADWHSLYGAALRLGDKAIAISASSGIGKTTLALELMRRGAGFYSDEFVFIRKSDKAVAGLARALVIRQRTLSFFADPRLQAVCESSAPRMPHGDLIWDNIDPGDVFGEQVFAQPAPLTAAIMLERATGDKVLVEQVPAALAAADFTKRVNAPLEPFDRLVDTALMLAGTPCYRVGASSPQRAASAIEALLR